MKYCTNCGSQIDDEAIICIHCGCAVQKAQPQPPVYNAPADKADAALVVLCVLFPIVGLVLWAVKRDESPVAARSYGKAALISFCVCTALIVLLYAVIFAYIGFWI